MAFSCVSQKKMSLFFKSFNGSLQILAYDGPIRSKKKTLIGSCDVAVIGVFVFVLYALVKSVLKHALRLTICSRTFILSLHCLVSSHVMYYRIGRGCRVSQFSMFLI